jgi:arsenical pump membrane protein
MTRVGDQLTSIAPALGFLLAGVPLAVLMDRLGCFDAVAVSLARRRREMPVVALWLLAAATTVVLNLDTTIVLLTPLYLRLALRARVDPVALVAVPLLLASLASSVLPVSNLTTLIVTDRLDLGVGDVVGHLAFPSLAAVAVGWWCYRRRYPTVLVDEGGGEPDRRALLPGGVIVGFLLVGFVVGPSFGIDPWMTAVAADVVLVVLTRSLPWRSVPVVTAVAVAALAAVVALVVPEDAFSTLLGHGGPWALFGIAWVATVAANLVNNLPAVLVALNGVHRMTWGMWAWLLGVNTGAVLVTIGAVANLLWRRIGRDEGVEVGLRRYVAITVPIAVPACVAAFTVLALERAVVG